MNIAKNKFRKWIVLGMTALVIVTAYSFKDEYFEVSKNLDMFTTLYREVNMFYVDKTDPGKLMKTGMDAMLESLDPYTNFIPESEIADHRFMTTGQYGGIGALIRMRNNNVIISEPYEGYPAQKSGLLAGDLILEIDGNSTKGKKSDEVSRALKGSPGTIVNIIIQREGEIKPLPFEISREEIKVKNVPYYGIVSDGIAYIRLSHFTENASREVADALKKLKATDSINGVVLDLRGNPGGLLHEAVNVSNIFVDRGKEIVSTKSKLKDLDKTYKAINSPHDTGIPLTVLVNSGSASASEIVSGSLQDLDRAVIVGQRTFGKGLVQTTRPLSYNAQLKITTAKYYIPSGRCIQAVDYSNRNEDGSVGKVPDSLMKPFKTMAGRKVFDGGGVLPDILIQNPALSDITRSLVSKSLIFDFATKFHRKNPSIASVGEFKLSESDWNSFTNYIADKEYDYVKDSEKKLEELRKSTEQEQSFDEIRNEFEALKVKMSHNKQLDVQKNKGEIIRLLEEEIISRYYFQSGKIQASLRHDKELEKAIEILKHESRYAGILNGTLNAHAGEEEK